MSFESFQNRVNRIIDRMSGEKPTVNFRHDNGRHYANFSDGTTIIGNTIAKSVTVRWGSGHTANATI